MERLTARQLRDAAGREGYPVSGRQLTDFREAGLLPEPDEDGRWPAAAVEVLVRVRQLGKVPGLRPLSRRAIRLWMEGQPISPEHLKQAVLDVARTLTSPERKMVRVRRAWRWLGDLEYRSLSPRSRKRIDPAEALLPKHDQWRAILEQTEPMEIAERIGRLAYLAGAMKPREVEPVEYVADVPVEEIVVLMLIQELAFTARSDPPTPPHQPLVSGLQEVGA